MTFDYYIFFVFLFTLFAIAFCLLPDNRNTQIIRNCKIRGVVEMSNNSLIIGNNCSVGSKDIVGNACTPDGTVTCAKLCINGYIYAHGEKIEPYLLGICYDSIKSIRLGKGSTVSLNTDDVFITAYG